MALTYSNKSAYVIGDRVQIDVDYAGDTSYSTGGYALSASAFDLDSITSVTATIKPVSAAGLTYYDPSTGKLLFYTALTGTEVSGSTNVSTVTGHLRIVGKGRTSFGV